MDDRIAVSFPNMGIELDISPIAFKVFGIPIYWYGIIIAFAFLVCVLWAMRDAKKFNFETETVIDLLIFAAPAAIICARIYYVIFSWENYNYDLMSIIATRDGGLAIYGGVIGAVVTAYFVAKYKKIPTFKFFDFFIPYLALGQAIGRWGNFFNQEAFGTNTSLPWGMTSPTTQRYLSNNAQSLKDINGITVYPDLPVHPTFLYESILCLAIFALLLWIRKKKKFDGEVFCLYFVTYCLGRAFIEGLRTDSLMIGNLRVSQLLSIILVILFGILIIYMRIKVRNESIGDGETVQSGYADILKIMEEEDRLEAEQQQHDLQSKKEQLDSELELGNNNVEDDIKQSESQIESEGNQTEITREENNEGLSELENGKE